MALIDPLSLKTQGLRRVNFFMENQVQSGTRKWNPEVEPGRGTR